MGILPGETSRFRRGTEDSNTAKVNCALDQGVSTATTQRPSPKQMFAFTSILLCVAVSLYVNLSLLNRHGEAQVIFQNCDNKVPSPTLQPSFIKHDEPVVVNNGQIKDLVENFRTVVHSLLEIETASWFRYLGAYRVESTENNRLTNRLENTAPPQSQIENDSFVSSINKMIWDDENDIPSYLERLQAGCSYDAIANSTYFDAECFDFLQSLIQDPRCTVRLDSRFPCHHDKDRVTPNGVIESDEHGGIESIMDNFSEETINVVILGAGPVGLFLANALIELQLKEDSPWRRHENNAKLKPSQPIRILMFENRALAEGHKKPYSRTWETGIGPQYVKDTIDSRVYAIFKALLPGYLSLPLNVWETLLLLSNRDRGVKFIYGDVKDYEAHLVNVPNLIIFDATGHRLEPLDRSKNGEKVDEYQTFSWKASVPAMAKIVVSRWGFSPNLLRPRPGRNESSPLKIAIKESASGTLLYPVLDNNNAYDVRGFDINFLPRNETLKGKLVGIGTWLETVLEATNGFSTPRQGGPIFYYDDSVNFREDIWRRMNQQNSIEGWNVHSLGIKPAAQQGRFMEAWIRRNMRDGETGVPLSRFQINARMIRTTPLLKSNKLGKILLHIKEAEASAERNPDDPGPLLTTYRSQPYMYMDPIVPGGYSLLDGTRRVPLLRIGDSLFVGDTDISSGLEMHMLLIHQFQCLLMENVDHPSCPMFSNK